MARNRKIMSIVAVFSILLSLISCCFLFEVNSKAGSNYKNTYKKYVRKHAIDLGIADYNLGSFVDLNADGTPELILWAPDDHHMIYILSIYKGKVKESARMPYVYLMYAKGKNRIYTSGHVTMSPVDFNYFGRIVKGVLKDEIGGDTTSLDGTAEPTWNGRTVSMAKYNSNVKKYKRKYKYVNPYNKKKAINPSKWIY